MVAAVRAVDPDFFARVGEGPLSEEGVVESRLRLSAAGDAEAARIDARLGSRTALLVDFTARGPETTAEAVRLVLGVTAEALPDARALELALDPSQNRYRLETLNLGLHSPLTRALHHSTYTFLKKLSHTADSQDQRHRMVPASRPLLTLTDTARPDYLTPALIAGNPEALALYQESMERAWAAKNRLGELGAPLQSALYLLPNAKALRFHETGSLLYLGHKWVMRTCLNAQEEIYRASMDELDQVRAVHPALVRHMGPPCVLRAGRITPTCTEGEHFCGVPVWRTFPNVARRI
jgi:thymidylate synthase ThyX